MKAEMPVEIEDRRTGHRDSGSFGEVARVPVGDDHAETVDRAALEEADQGLAGRGGAGADGVGGAIEKERVEAEADKGQTAAPDEGPAGDVAHRRLLLTLELGSA